MDPRHESQNWRREPWPDFGPVEPPLDLYRTEPFPTLQPHQGSSLALNMTLPLSHPVGRIPCELDRKTGSTSEAEKRKLYSDASRRFRHRKKEAGEREKGLQAKIHRLQAEIVRLTDENSSLRD